MSIITRIGFFLLIILAPSVSIAQSKMASWAKQSNIYEVNLRQYSASGSIVDFQKHLPRLKKMGVEILYFMPVTPIGVVGRKMNENELGSYYAVRNYKAFNEEFGTMEQWKSFVQAAHFMGFKVITDWVANHTAPDNPWIREHLDFYTKDKDGKLIAPFDRTDVRKLNYVNRELRDSMISAMKFWIDSTGIDGFRCDLAEEVPVDFWKECISALRGIKDVFMLAEGENPELHKAGFNATYAWGMMHLMKELYEGRKSVVQFDSALNASIGRFPNADRMYFTTNHDENSWNGTEFEKYGDAYKMFAVFTQTVAQSVPMIYSGQEIPNRKRLKFFVKDPIQWSDTFDMAPFYTTLLKLRRSTPALATDGEYKRISPSESGWVFAYTRRKFQSKVLVILNFSGKEQVFNVQDKSLEGTPFNVFTGEKESMSVGKKITLPPWGYFVYNYR